MQALTVGALLIVALALFVSERVRADLAAMIVLAALFVLRILPAEEALSGFSHPATVTVACMFVLSAGLEASGAIRWLGDRFLEHGPAREWALLLLVALVIGPVSAFINNTAAVAIFLPVVVRACHGKGISPSRILMPMAFLAILGGTCTVIGTSTNILVSSMAVARGQPAFGMFEFSRLGAIFFAVGAVYLVLVGRRLLPRRVRPESLTTGYHLEPYLTEVVVLPESPLVGSALGEARLAERHDLQVLALIRGGKVRPGVPDEDEVLREADVLLVEGSAAALLSIRDAMGFAVRPGRHPDDADLRSSDSALVEAVVLPNSPLESRTLKAIDFRHRYGATVLAIRRRGEDIRGKIGHLRLAAGDEMLLLVPRRDLDRLRGQRDFVLLEELEVARVRPARAALAAAIVAGVVAAAALRLYPTVACALAGAVLMAVTGCVSMRRAYESVEWKVIFLLAGVIPLGAALESTGAAAGAVRGLLWLVEGWGPAAVLSLFFLATCLLTGCMSNTATAALMVPLALTTAGALGVSGRPFLVAIAFAASAAFHTPIGYQTNLLVYGPGGYRFSDFLRVGGPLNLVFWALASILIPVLFPF